jgi:hypothetical protein
MNSARLALFVALAVAVGPLTSRLFSQEALEIRGDQENPEPTPIPQKKTKQPEPPAESDSESPQPTPKKKPKEKGLTNVQEMSPEEFKRAGLDKLSPDELRTLNEWMKGYRQAAEAKAASQATEQTREKAKEEGRQEGRAEANAEAKKNFNRTWLSTDRIFSRVDGEFHGIQAYQRKAIIRLEDGTVWKQANEGDHCEAKLTDHPPVMVTHSVVGYKMHVIGAGEFYVNPVHQH